MILADPECLFIAGATDTIVPFPAPMMGKVMCVMVTCK